MVYIDDELMTGADDDSNTLSSITNETETSPTDQGVLDDELDYQLVSVNTHVQNCIPIGRQPYCVLIDKNTIIYTSYQS